MTDATEVERLVKLLRYGKGVESWWMLGAEAADRIEAQAAEIARLRVALTMMVEDQCDYMNRNLLGDPEQQHIIKQARAALAATEQPE